MRPVLRLLVAGYVAHAVAVLLAPPLGLDVVAAHAPVAADPRTTAIVESTVSLAHALGLPVVAEGVETAETAEQADAARRAGCDRAQGYLFARPLAAADVPARCAPPTLAAA